MQTKFKTTNIFIIILILVAIGVGIYISINNKQSNENIQNTETDIGINKKEFKIVAFGDSLTAGFGVDLKDSYPSILENTLNTKPEYKNYNLNFKVINMGVSGETSSGGLDRVDFVLEQKPDLVLLGLGANDMLRSTDPALVLSNIDSMIEKITKSNVPVVLLGMQSTASNGRTYKKAFDSIYYFIAEKYNIPLVPFVLEGVVLMQSLNTSDGIHPNRLGYEKIIEKNILPILKPTLKKIID